MEPDERMKKEIEAMIDMVTEAPATEAPSTQSIGTDAPATDAPGTEPPATKAPATLAPSTEPPVEKEPWQEEMDSLKETNKQLLERLEKLEGPKTQPPSTEAPPEPVEFLGKDEDPEDYTGDREKFNELLNKVFLKGVESVRKGGTAPNADEINRQVAVAVQLQRTRDSFFEENPDLLEYQKDLAQIYSEVAQTNEEWSIEDCVEEAGKRARKKFNLPKQSPKPKPKSPSLPPGSKGGGKRPSAKPKLSPMEQEIMEMNKSL